MAGIKISALPAATSVATADLIPIVQSGVTKKATAEMIVDLISDNNICRLATAAALTATYANGTSGVGATLTNAGAFAALSIDSVATAVGDRILVKDQASTFENGVYSVTVVGDGVSVNWILTRVTDYDEADEITAGDFFTVAFGTTNAKTQWIETATVAVIGTDPITFESNVAAGTGITKTNNTIALTVPVALANGGTNKVMVADNGAIAYSDANSLELLASTATAGKMLQSGSSAAPSWSTPTYPSASGSAGVIIRSNGTNNVYSTSTFADTYAINSFLYASAANTVTALAPALSSVLASSAASTGVPTWVGPLTNGQVVVGSTGATPVAATLTAGTGISISNGAGSITINATGSGMATVEVTGTTQAMAVNTVYIANNAALVVFTLPASFAVGDAISVVGKGAGGWRIDQNAGQNQQVGSVSSTVGAGGSVASTNRFDSVNYLATTANVTLTTLGAAQSAGLTIV
jgi:hypothetical protein